MLFIPFSRLTALATTSRVKFNRSGDRGQCRPIPVSGDSSQTFGTGDGVNGGFLLDALVPGEDQHWLMIPHLQLRSLHPQVLKILSRYISSISSLTHVTKVNAQICTLIIFCVDCKTFKAGAMCVCVCVCND